jgi:hypothetical protein
MFMYQVVLDSSVNEQIGYGFEQLRFDSWQGLQFSLHHQFRLALGFTQTSTETTYCEIPPDR